MNFNIFVSRWKIPITTWPKLDTKYYLLCMCRLILTILDSQKFDRIKRKSSRAFQDEINWTTRRKVGKVIWLDGHSVNNCNKWDSWIHSFTSAIYFTLYSIHYTLYTIRYSVYLPTIHHTFCYSFYILHSTLIVHSTLYFLQPTLYIVWLVRSI